MQLTSEQLTALGRLATPEVADAIETFQVQLRNVGFADGTIRCCFDDRPPVVGYAATARIRTSIPPMVGAAYADRVDWWTSVRATPGPQIVVIEDADAHPGLGALVGELQGTVLRALGVVGIVTNGALRHLPQLHALGLQCFAPRVVPSHAYAHVFEFNVPVRVGGLDIAPGDLLHGDRNGLVRVPPEIAAHIPAAAAELRRLNAQILALSQSDAVDLERLRGLFAARHADAKPGDDSR
jgi:4-hydroxy-4-methyl-2-oxoglutarate aldolase